MIFLFHLCNVKQGMIGISGCNIMKMKLKELEFAVFCIENVAEKLNITGKDIFNLLTKNSNILDGYIVPSYDVLHTQGKNYIVNDIIECMTEQGVLK